MRSTGLGLQGRFLLGLACILFGCSLVSACFIYLWGKQSIEEEAQHRTALAMAAVNAVRAYVRDELRPRMYDLVGPDRLVIEAMSASYVSRAVMERLRRELPELRYRRVSPAPLNPQSRPDEDEQRILRYFADHPREANWQGMTTINGQPYYMRYEPVRYQASCRRCHQEQPDLPPAIRSRYPAAAYLPAGPPPLGLVSVGIPVDTSLARIRDRAFSVFVFAFGFIVALYSIIAFFFDRVVIQSLRDVLALFRDSLCDERGIQLYERAASRDAIEEITGAAQAMAAYIRDTERQLADHACNLEALVEERTAALRASRQQLQEKVRTRNRELHTLTSIAELITNDPDPSATLPAILRHVLEVVPAGGAALYTLGEPAILQLESAERAGDLPRRLACPADRGEGKEPQTVEEVLREAASGRLGFLASEQERFDCLAVPLASRGRVRGVMLFVAVDFMVLDQETTALLTAVGRQVGILLENMQTLRHLLETATLLQTVFDGISDPVVLLDADYRIRMVNQALADLHAGAPLIGRDCRRLAGCPFAAAGDLSFRPRTAETLLHRLEDGRIYEVHFYPLFDGRGCLANVVGYGKDVTEQHRAAERAQHTEKMAALGQLAAGIAHEINNPLGVILCHADLAAGELDDPEQLRRDLETIARHAAACQRIVGDLLQFARSSSGRKEPVAVAELLQETAAMVGRQLEKEGIRLHLSLDEPLPDVALDRDRMKQVLLNLVINAAQAMGKRGGAIEISARRQGESVTIEVADDGPGIDPAILDRIFEPFFSTKAPGEGTGLGLSVSYGIVRDHGGAINAANRPDGGAVFTVTLPLEGGRP